MSATWVQCTSVSNECSGGCRSMREHDAYRESMRLKQLKDELLEAHALGEQLMRERDEAKCSALEYLAQVATLTKERDEMRTAYEEEVARCVRAEDLARELTTERDAEKARADAAETACEGLREALENVKTRLKQMPCDPVPNAHDLPCRCCAALGVVQAALAAAPVKRQVKP